MRLCDKPHVLPWKAREECGDAASANGRAASGSSTAPVSAWTPRGFRHPITSTRTEPALAKAGHHDRSLGALPWRRPALGLASSRQGSVDPSPKTSATKAPDSTGSRASAWASAQARHASSASGTHGDLSMLPSNREVQKSRDRRGRLGRDACAQSNHHHASSAEGGGCTAASIPHWRAARSGASPIPCWAR